MEKGGKETLTRNHGLEDLIRDYGWGISLTSDLLAGNRKAINMVLLNVGAALVICCHSPNQ